MKVGILCSSTAWGGLEINTLYMARELTKQNFRVTIYCDSDSIIATESKKVGVSVTHFTHKQKHLNFGAARRLASLLDKEEIPVLLIAHYTQFYIGIMSKLFSKRKPKAVYIQQMQMKHNKKDPYHSFFYKHTDAWVVALEFIKQQLHEKIKIDGDKIRIITPLVDIARFLEAKQLRAKARANFQLSADAPVAGVIGRVDKVKGQEYFIKAIGLLRDEGVHIHGLIVGDESMGNTEGYRLYLTQLVKDLALEELVHFSPFIEDTPQAFGALDVFVMASLSEPFGMVTIEAMATGLTVIGTDAGGTSEILDYGAAGMLVPPCDERALADALKKAFGNQDLMTTLGQAGQERAQARYSQDVQMRLLKELIEELV
jgi:glycosyltransferase involved in cell wall biosynthesis